MNNNTSIYMSIKQVADYLGVSKKTLMRWDKENYFSSREAVTNARVYLRKDVEMAKKWLDLREKHRKHLKKLREVQKNLDKFLVVHPLVPGEPIKHFWRLEELKSPFNAMRQWKEEEKEIMKEYYQFDNWKYRKIERDLTDKNE